MLPLLHTADDPAELDPDGDDPSAREVWKTYHSRALPDDYVCREHIKPGDNVSVFLYRRSKTTSKWLCKWHNGTVTAVSPPAPPHRHVQVDGTTFDIHHSPIIVNRHMHILAPGMAESFKFQKALLVRHGVSGDGSCLIHSLVHLIPDLFKSMEETRIKMAETFLRRIDRVDKRRTQEVMDNFGWTLAGYTGQGCKMILQRKGVDSSRLEKLHAKLPSTSPIRNSKWPSDSIYCNISDWIELYDAIIHDSDFRGWLDPMPGEVFDIMRTRGEYILRNPRTPLRPHVLTYLHSMPNIIVINANTKQIECTDLPLKSGRRFILLL